MKLLLKNVRLAFCQYIFEKGTNFTNAEEKFSANFLIPKGDPQIKKVEKMIADVAREKWEKKTEAVMKLLTASDKICLRDGSTKAEYEGFDECYFISAASDTQPTIIDRDRTQLTKETGRPYAGCYVNASIDIWAMDSKFGKRICAGLRGIQFLADGDAFTGSAPATPDEFEYLSDTGEPYDDEALV